MHFKRHYSSLKDKNIIKSPTFSEKVAFNSRGQKLFFSLESVWFNLGVVHTELDNAHLDFRSVQLALKNVQFDEKVVNVISRTSIIR